MLTEGWDCNTVTHIIGLRPFMSQLLCEQVVGRGLRRLSYAVEENGRLSEEVAKIFGVPFEVIPLKTNPPGRAEADRRRHGASTLCWSALIIEIRFPRVEGYTSRIRNRIRVDWDSIAPLTLDPLQIPPEVEMKAGMPSNTGRPSLIGPGKIEHVDLSPYRRGRRRQRLVFEMARDLTRSYCDSPDCAAPAHALFPQLATVVQRYLDQKVRPIAPAKEVDAFLSPWYGWLLERLLEAIHEELGDVEVAESPRYETNRGPGSTEEVDFETRREPYPVTKSHVNAVVPDTAKWEQSAAYQIDRNKHVKSFVKNAGLGFAIPYLHNGGEHHEYIPDFIIQLTGPEPRYLILETKGYDPLREVKEQAAKRWVRAVNATEIFGQWEYAMVTDVAMVDELISRAATIGAQ